MKKILLCFAILTLSASAVSAEELDDHFSHVNGDTGTAISGIGAANTGNVFATRTIDLGSLAEIGDTSGDVPAVYINTMTAGGYVSFEGDVTDNFNDNFSNNFNDNFSRNFSDNSTGEDPTGSTGYNTKQSLMYFRTFLTYLQGDYGLEIEEINSDDFVMFASQAPKSE